MIFISEILNDIYKQNMSLLSDSSVKEICYRLGES